MKTDKIEIIIRSYHIDSFGHVNNARYLEFIEEGRWALEIFDLKKLKKKNLGPVVVNINTNYLYPASVGDTIEVVTKLGKIKNKSCEMTQKIFIKGTDKMVIDAKVTFVFIDTIKQKAVLIKEIDLLKKYF